MNAFLIICYLLISREYTRLSDNRSSKQTNCCFIEFLLLYLPNQIKTKRARRLREASSRFDREPERLLHSLIESISPAPRATITIPLFPAASPRRSPPEGEICLLYPRYDHGDDLAPSFTAAACCETVRGFSMAQRHRFTTPWRALSNRRRRTR